MTATVSPLTYGREGEGDVHTVAFDFTPDTAYPAGGYPLSGLGSVLSVMGNLPGLLTQFDAANQKLRLYWSSGAATALGEVAPGTDLSAVGTTRLGAIVAGA